jgi:hypothetical protein
MYNDFNPSLIRKCELIKKDGKDYLQFIGIGDRHKMMKMEDGSITIIKLPEQGKDYNYGDAIPLEDALKILEQGAHSSHFQLARQIRHYLAQKTA